MHRAIAPGTGISIVQRSAMSVQPSSRAACAGNALRRSGVTVKRALMMSAGASSLSATMRRSSSAVAARMAEASSSSTVVAPRIAPRCRSWGTRSGGRRRGAGTPPELHIGGLGFFVMAPLVIMPRDRSPACVRDPTNAGEHFGREEYRNQHGIELRPARFGESAHPVIEPLRAMIAPTMRDRIEGIGNRHDPRLNENVLGDEPMRVARTVTALRAREHDHG